MKYSFVAATLIASALAVPAWSPSGYGEESAPPAEGKCTSVSMRSDIPESDVFRQAMATAPPAPRRPTRPSQPTQ